MKTKLTIFALGLLLGVSISAHAQKFSAEELKRRTIERRAVEAAIWGIPAVNTDLMFQALTRDAKGAVNQIVYWSKPLTWKNQTLTPNPDALYFMPFWNTKEVGPIVVEVPPAEGGSITGSLMDVWQVPLEDVGPAGVDKGQGGKYLVLPPDYKDKAPEGYIVLPSSTYQGYGLLRSILKSRSDADVAAAVEYGRRIKIYPLSEAASPEATKLLDANEVLFDSTIPYDVRFFESLHRMVQIEPWLRRDQVMVEGLKSLGIERGKAFAPDAKTKQALTSALNEARQWLEYSYETLFTPYFPSGHYFVPASEELIRNQHDGFTAADSYPIDARATIYYAAFSGLKNLGAGQFYLFVTRDKTGASLEGAKNYRLHVPPSPPVTQYWSLVLYDVATHALIRDMPHSSRSSLQPDLAKNADGSVDVYLGEKAPAGKEKNWIPTKPGGRFEAIFRLYGPEEPLFKKTWVLPDIEEVK